MQALTIDTLLGTSTGKAMLAELNDRQLAERKQLVIELGRLRTDCTARTAELVDAHRKAIEAKELARRTLDAAVIAEQEAGAALTVFDGSIQRSMDLIRHQLRQSADPQIGEFQAWCRASLAAQRLEANAPHPISNHPIDAPKRIALAAAVARVQDRVRALRDAIESAEALKLEAFNPGQVAKALEKIKAGIPSVFAAVAA